MPATDNKMISVEDIGFAFIGRGGEAGAQIPLEKFFALLKKGRLRHETGSLSGLTC